jgi:hypothetical protein
MVDGTTVDAEWVVRRYAVGRLFADEEKARGRSSLSNRIANSRGSAANKKAYPGAKALGYLEAKTTADATTTAKTKCGGPSTAPFTVRL